MDTSNNTTALPQHTHSYRGTHMTLPLDISILISINAIVVNTWSIVKKHPCFLA